jgi:hypothetical protein
LIEKWIHTVRKMNRFFADFPFNTKTIVHYEELAEHPGDVVRRVCQFLDVSYEEEMLRYWRHPHHPIAGNGGTQSLVLRFRESLGEISPGQRESANEGDRYYQGKYYDEVGFAIHLDERWRRELTQQQIERFDTLAGRINQDFVYSN